MKEKEFIKKWNVAYEDKEQEIEFSKEMSNDLKLYSRQLQTELKEAREMEEKHIKMFTNFLIDEGYLVNVSELTIEEMYDYWNVN